MIGLIGVASVISIAIGFSGVVARLLSFITNLTQIWILQRRTFLMKAEISPIKPISCVAISVWNHQFQTCDS